MSIIIIVPAQQQWWMLIFTTTLLSLCVLTVSSSSSSSSSSFHNSNNNYNVYQYDRTSSHFTPDGRLMQVEYACSAADHSSPLIVFQYNTNTEKEQDDDDQLLILLTLKRSSATTTSTTTSSSGSSPNTGSSSSSNISSSSQFLQQRLVLLPDNHGHGTIIIVLSGILADCTFLLHKLQEDDLHHRRLFGSGAGAAAHVWTPQKIASCLSLTCQKHAIGGGIRPFGSTGFHLCTTLNSPLASKDSMTLKRPWTGSRT